MARWPNGVRTVQFLVDRGRLGAFVSSDLTGLVTAQVHRATLRLNATAVAALENGDVDGAYAAASDAYRMTAEALLARQGLRATGSDGSHMSVEDAVSAQFAAAVEALAKPVFERLGRTRPSAQFRPVRRRRPAANPGLRGPKSSRARTARFAATERAPTRARLSRLRCNPYWDRSWQGTPGCSPGAPLPADSVSRSTRIRSPC